eukprot:768299-Hanusia_phi.AAC.2
MVRESGEAENKQQGQNPHDRSPFAHRCSPEATTTSETPSIFRCTSRYLFSANMLEDIDSDRGGKLEQAAEGCKREKKDEGRQGKGDASRKDRGEEGPAEEEGRRRGGGGGRGGGEEEKERRQVHCRKLRHHVRRTRWGQYNSMKCQIGRVSLNEDGQDRVGYQYTQGRGTWRCLVIRCAMGGVNPDQGWVQQVGYNFDE